MTRRQWAALVGAAPLSLPAPAQTQAPGASKLPDTPKTVSENPDAEMRMAEDRIRSNSDRLAQVALPMATEPAVHFKA